MLFAGLEKKSAGNINTNIISVLFGGKVRGRLCAVISGSRAEPAATFGFLPGHPQFAEGSGQPTLGSKQFPCTA